jgi:serine/threonine protein kinase
MFIRLKPVCAPYTIKNLIDFGCSLVHIATGINSLHDNGFLHRDIRWANIVYDAENCRFLLIDFEHCSTVDESEILVDDFSQYIPQVLKINDKFTKRHDWWMFGKMIADALEKRSGVISDMVIFSEYFSNDNNTTFTDLSTIEQELLNLDGDEINGQNILDRLK